MRLGYKPMALSYGLHGGSFNEAEARAPRIPGKYGDYKWPSLNASMRPRRVRLGYATSGRSRARMAPFRFNEAEARAPRIPTLDPPSSERTESASMRPRRVRLGYRSTLSVGLQRVYCFNEAEARAPRILRR